MPNTEDRVDERGLVPVLDVSDAADDAATEMGSEAVAVGASGAFS